MTATKIMNVKIQQCDIGSTVRKYTVTEELAFSDMTISDIKNMLRDWYGDHIRFSKPRSRKRGDVYRYKWFAYDEDNTLLCIIKETV